MTASNIVIRRWIGAPPCFQAIHMGVAYLNAQSVTTEQGDDLEHTGHVSFSHSQRQPTRLTGACAQAWGTSSASSPTRGCMQRQTSGPALGLIGWLQAVCVLEDWIVFLYQHGGWQNLANGKQLTTPHLLVTSQPIYPTLFKVNSHNFIYTFILLWGKKKPLHTLPLWLIHPWFATTVHSTPLLFLFLTIHYVPPHVIFSPLPPLPSYFIIHFTPF